MFNALHVKCLQKKHTKALVKVIMMFNHAVNACTVHRCVLCKIMKDIQDDSFLDNPYLPFLHLLPQAVLFKRC